MPYSGKRGNRLVFIFAYFVQRWSIATCFLLLIFSPVYLFAQKDEDANDDEITVMIEVSGIGNAEMPAIIRDKDIYLPMNMLFDFLKIKNTPSVSFDSLSGFYVNQENVFLIDKSHNRITFKDTITDLKSGDLLKQDNNLYLNLKYFKPVFRLNGVFNFRRLAVTLSSDIELPAIREAKQELMRRNVNRLNGTVVADTNIGRDNPFFHLGMADWALMSTQQSIGSNETRLNLGLGGVLAGGEANASLNYSTLYKFDERQQFYQWRYVNGDNNLLTQVVAGKIFAQSISTLSAPVVGIQLTNAPTTYRKSYGSYTISNTTDPGWIVELYVNSILVDYKKADAGGFYTFEVPLVYGYSVIKLRFLGPYGEERITQSFINIPFNFLPVHEFEYTASAGVVEDGLNSVFSRVGLNYGITNRITVGGGLEYLSSVTSGQYIPFLCASIKLAQNLLVSGEYDYGVRTRGTLSYRLPYNMQLDLDIINYDKGQTAIYYNYLAERKFTISAPLNTGFMTLFSRFILDQITLPYARYTNAEWTFTGTIKKVGVNFSNYASFEETTDPYFYGLASLNYMLPKKINFNAQLQYDYKQNKPEFVKFTFEKHLLGKGFLNVSYQQFFSSLSESYTTNYNNILVGMRYDFAFARVAFSTLSDNQGGYSRVETASGSLIYDHKTGYLNANNRTNVGKGGITIEPFLDINCNGIWDPGEPKVPGLKLHINGGRIIYDDKDTLVRILDLDPYASYILELNKNSFDNIAWQIKNHTIRVTINPNNLTLIEVPVAVVGEVSGVVSLTDRSGIVQKGERQISINIYNSDSGLVARTLTESDGFFSYTGLPPGVYKVQVDTSQLLKLHLKPKQMSLPVTIKPNIDGDVVDGLEFILLPAGEDSILVTNPVPGTISSQNTTAVLLPSAEDSISTRNRVPGTMSSQNATPALVDSGLTQVNINNQALQRLDYKSGMDSLLMVNSVFDSLTGRIILAQKGTYTIQVCAVHNEQRAKRIQAALMKQLKRPVAIVHKGNYYKPRIIGFRKNKDARAYMPKLAKKGIKGFIKVKLLYPIYK